MDLICSNPLQYFRLTIDQTTDYRDHQVLFNKSFGRKQMKILNKLLILLMSVFILEKHLSSFLNHILSLISY